MKRFIEGVDRGQSTLFPDRLGDWIGDDNAVRVVDVFVDELNLGDLGFGRVQPLSTGRPGYHPSLLLKLCIYGYVNRVQSSRRLEREAGRNVEVMWLTRRLVPDHKTIADFRKDNGPAIRKVCAQFVALCRRLDLFAEASVAIDGSKFKAVNNRDRNFTRAKMKRRLTLRRYWTNACLNCAIRHRCTTGRERRITRWQHEYVLETVQRRLDEHPERMRQRRETVEHPFGTIKARMGATHFLMKTLPRVRTEMALHVLAYNFTRLINILGTGPLMAAMRA